MANRMKELILCLVDVSISMEDSLSGLTASLFTLVHSQLLYKPDNEIGLTLFGTSRTDNVLHEEKRKRKKGGQCSHVAEVCPIEKPDLTYLEAVNRIQPEKGQVDYTDALTVALDSIKRKTARMDDSSKYKISLLMFSNFIAKMNPVERELSELLTQTMEELNIHTEIYVINADKKHSKMKSEERDIAAMLGLVTRTVNVKQISTEIELYSLFPVKPIACQTMYKGPLDIGGMMTISVKVFKKTSRESLPSLKPYSSRKKAKSATHEVVRDVEYKSRENPTEPVPPEYHAKGYLYGIQYIPVTREIEQQIEYQPVKGMCLIGFVSREQIPRYHYLKDTFIVLPERDEGSQRAISALVQQCGRMEKMAIVRCALRKGSQVFLGVLSPLADRDRHPDAFLMNIVPFADDVREFYFSSFSSKESLIPTDEQMTVMGQIVNSDARMETELQKALYTDRVSNPLLQRFHRCLGKRAFEEGGLDPLTNMVFPTDCSRFGAGIEETLEASVHLFKKQKREVETAKMMDDA